MQINRDIDFTHYTIQGYAEGQVTVVIPRRHETPSAGNASGGSGAGEPRRETFHRSLIVMPDRLVADWPPQTLEQLEPGHLEVLLEESLEVVLLGTGARLRHPDPGITSALVDHGVGVELMDTGSACRTYNFLMADRRRVAAALMMITANPA